MLALFPPKPKKASADWLCKLFWKAKSKSKQLKCIVSPDKQLVNG